MKTYYVTASIPYVNGAPHVGHALEYIQTDAIARYFKSKLGLDSVLAISGTDENSLKNVRAAEEAGEDIATFVKKHSAEFYSLYNLLDLSFGDFIRTREDRHIQGAQKLWSMFKEEDVYSKQYKGLYCVGCEAFYTEKDCEDGLCPIHKKELEVVEETNYFFKLSNYQEELERLIETDEIKILPETRKNEALSFVKQGLEDFSISRSQARAKNWGVPVPNDESQVMYVWVDALSNYINILDFANDGKLYKKFWENGDKRVHILGKDIARFHTIYWPAMLLSAGLKIPTDIYVHGFFTVEGEKMSKTLGNVIHPKELVEEFGVDAVRYFMLREMPYASDGDLAKERIELRYAELANQLGNLVGRVASMSNKYFDGKVEKPELDWNEQILVLDRAMNEFKFKEYLDVVFKIVARANEIIDKTAPFKLVKTDPDGAKRVLGEVAEMIRFIGNTLLPIMPSTAEEILRRYEGDVLVGDPLFPRRDK